MSRNCTQTKNESLSFELSLGRGIGNLETLSCDLRPRGKILN